MNFYLQQFGKFTPINIRGLLGVLKSYNPKALGLISESYLILYEAEEKKEYLKKAEKLIGLLEKLRAPGFEEYAWGYNFPWANRNFYLPAFQPSVVVSSTIGRMLYRHYIVTGDEKSLEKLKSIGAFILKRLNRYETDEHLCFSYTPYDRTKIFNASLMGAEILSYIYLETKDDGIRKTVEKSARYVLDQQEKDGSWIYGYDESGRKITLYDFHQGFVLDSLGTIGKSIGMDVSEYLKRGISFYKEKLFYPNGMSVYRYPKKYPVDIHNQAQGIITFAKHGYREFSEIIAGWTVKNMQDSKGYFYYQRWPFFVNKIPYMRWGQAWMMFALSDLIYRKKVRK